MNYEVFDIRKKIMFNEEILIVTFYFRYFLKFYLYETFVEYLYRNLVVRIIFAFNL